MEIKNERELMEGFQSTVFIIDENKRLNSTLDNHIVDSIPILSKAFEVKNVVQIKKMDSSVPSQLLWTGDCDILDTNLWDSKHMTYDTDLKYCDLDELLYNGTDLQLENQTIILENDATASCSNSYSAERHYHHDTNFMTILYTPRVEQDQSSDQSDQLISSPSGPLSPTDSNISFTSSNIEFESRTRTLSDEEIKYKESKNQTRQSSLTNLNGNTTETDSQKDEKYWARRKKNNIAAKRSRDARRKKENQVAIRAAFLENENKYLRQEIERLKMENFTLSGNLMKLNSPLEDQK